MEARFIFLAGAASSMTCEAFANTRKVIRWLANNESFRECTGGYQ